MIQRLTTAIAVTAIGLALFCTSAFAAGSDAFEPNDAPAGATGPLVGGQLYQAGITSALDRDYYYFNTAAAGTFNVAIVDYGDPWNYCRKDWVALTASGDLLDYETSWGSNDIYGGGTGSSAVLSFVSGAGAKVYVRVSGEPNPYCWDYEGYYNPGPDLYSLRILPAEAVTTAALPGPTPPPSDKCVAAKTSAAKAAVRIKRLKKHVAAAGGKKARRLRARLRVAKSDLKTAKKRVSKYC